MFYCFFGLTLLFLGAEALVRSSSKIAKIFKISQLLIALTLVAYGTSSPELFVSAFASLSAKSEIAISNVLGSNIFNLLFILGISSLITPLSVHEQLIKRDIPLMILCSFVLWLIAFSGGITAWHGTLLLLTLVTYTYWLAKKSSSEKTAQKKTEKTPFAWKSLGLQSMILVFSLGLLKLGAEFFIQGAIELAHYFSLSERVIGLSIVAVGTSLPEAATSIVAAIKKEKDIAVGNVIGSNICNILAVLGICSVISPSELSVPSQALSFELPFLAISSILALPFLFSKYTLSRAEGALFLLGYLGYLGYLLYS